MQTLFFAHGIVQVYYRLRITPQRILIAKLIDESFLSVNGAAEQICRFVQEIGSCIQARHEALRPSVVIHTCAFTLCADILRVLTASLRTRSKVRCSFVSGLPC